MKFLRFLKKFSLYIVIGLLLIAIILGLNVKSEKYNLDYSTYNTDDNGTKALYLLTERMGYQVDRFDKSSRFLEEKNLLVMFAPVENEFLKDEEQNHLLQWLKKGNSLVLIDNIKLKNNFLKNFSITNENIDHGTLYSIGKGQVIILKEPNEYTNKYFKDVKYSENFISVIDFINNKSKFNKVIFDEYYLMINNTAATVFDIFDGFIILGFMQIIFAVVILLYIKSRRFGKPRVVFENIKREENENLFALSNIYKKARAYNLVLELYYNRFKKDISKYLGLSIIADKHEILNVAASNDYLNKYSLDKLLKQCEDVIPDNNLKKNNMISLVKKIDEIRKGLN
jgi:hypothetical protein